jgi:capsular exopolysaccharide synthesis family protein
MALGNDPLANAEAVDLRDYLRVVIKRIPTILLCVALTVGIAAAYVLISTPIYRSTAIVLMKPTGVDLTAVAGNWDKVISPETEKAIVESLDVGTAVAQRFGGRTSALALLRHVDVSVTADTQTMSISYSSPDPHFAANAAQAFAEAYLTTRQEQARKDVSDQADGLNNKIDTLRTRLKELNATIETSTSASEVDAAKLDRNSLLPQLAYLQTQLGTVNVLNTTPGEVIYDAQVPGSPSSPNVKLIIAFGLVAGLVLGVAAAFLRDRMDEHVRTPEEVEALLETPVLARVPEQPGRGPAIGVLSPRDLRAPEAEVFRALRTTLLAGANDGDQVIMVSSSVPDEGKSVVATNLAIVLAQADKEVVLVSADLRKPSVHLFLGVHNAVGLADAVEDEVPLDEVLQPTAIANLSVVASGRPSGGPTELLGSREMHRLLSSLRERFDHVIVDSAPLLSVADSLALAQSVDGILLVSDVGRTTRSALVEMRHQLDRIGARVVGIVLNKVDASSARHRYGYGYGYGHGHEVPMANGRPPVATPSSNGDDSAHASDAPRPDRRGANAR